MSFRAMRRANQALKEEDCVRILKEERRAVVSVIGDDGYPYGVPVNYYYDEATKCIYFHCSQVGHKIDAIRKCDKVCFTVYDGGFKKEDWSYYVSSVICFGRADEMDEGEEKYDISKRFGLKYFPTEEELQEVLDRSYARLDLVRIRIEHMTGKLVHEK